MTLDQRFDLSPSSAPSLGRLVQESAVVPIEVVPRTDYSFLPSLGDIVNALPADDDPDEELVPTVRLPRRRRTGGRNVARATAALFVTLAGTGVAMAAWMTPAELGTAPSVPIVVGPSRIGIDTEALSLAVGAEALRRVRVPMASTVTDEPESDAPPAATRFIDEAPVPAPAIDFDPDAASWALDRAAVSAGTCRSVDDPSGVARVIVTFAPSGRVTSATVNGPPFAGTTTGGCVARFLRSATVPPFSGDHVTVAKTVVVR